MPSAESIAAGAGSAVLAAREGQLRQHRVEPRDADRASATKPCQCAMASSIGASARDRTIEPAIIAPPDT